jgi:hypothetical protein
VVITSALHAEGREFDPRSKYNFLKIKNLVVKLLESRKFFSLRSGCLSTKKIILIKNNLCCHMDLFLGHDLNVCIENF